MSFPFFIFVTYDPWKNNLWVIGYKQKEGQKMRGSVKLAIATLSALTLLAGGIPWLYQWNSLQNADMVVRVGYTGLDNLFHERYGYYAVTGSRHVKVAPVLVQRLHPEWDLEESVYDDEEKNYYFVQLQYCPDGEPQFQTETIDIGQDREYVVTYREWTRKSEAMEEGVKDLAVQVIMQNYDFSVPYEPDDENVNWIWSGGGDYGLDSFMLVTEKGVTDRGILYSDYSNRVRCIRDGEVYDLMDVPEKGQVEFIYLTEK